MHINLKQLSGEQIQVRLSFKNRTNRNKDKQMPTGRFNK